MCDWQYYKNLEDDKKEIEESLLNPSVTLLSYVWEEVFSLFFIIYTKSNQFN